MRKLFILFVHEIVRIYRDSFHLQVNNWTNISLFTNIIPLQYLHIAYFQQIHAYFVKKFKPFFTSFK